MSIKKHWQRWMYVLDQIESNLQYGSHLQWPIKNGGMNMPPFVMKSQNCDSGMV